MTPYPGGRGRISAHLRVGSCEGVRAARLMVRSSSSYHSSPAGPRHSLTSVPPPGSPVARRKTSVLMRPVVLSPWPRVPCALPLWSSCKRRRKREMRIAVSLQGAVLVWRYSDIQASRMSGVGGGCCRDRTRKRRRKGRVRRTYGSVKRETRLAL